MELAKTRSVANSFNTCKALSEFLSRDDQKVHQKHLFEGLNLYLCPTSVMEIVSEESLRPVYSLLLS